jgi:hypothetical protein
MLFELQEAQNRYTMSQRRYTESSAEAAGLLEKDVENWIAGHPELVLPNEPVLVIGQSVAGQSMADVLALDNFGRLILIEIKRQLCDRETVGQLLEYAARMRNLTYDQLNQIAKRYRDWSGGELHKRFCEYFEGANIPAEKLGRDQRVLIVGSHSDKNLDSVITWLRQFNVPVAFVPFAIYADSKGIPCLLRIDGIVTSPELDLPGQDWKGHWIFNTNETYAVGAYDRMFSKGVAAIYGYPNGGGNLEGAESGQKVFAYVNQQGLRALGIIKGSDVVRGKGIFDDANDDEYHLPVDWQIILPKEKSIKPKQAQGLGYNLPVRTVFGKLHNGTAAITLENELKRRASGKG